MIFDFSLSDGSISNKVQMYNASGTISSVRDAFVGTQYAFFILAPTENNNQGCTIVRYDMTNTAYQSYQCTPTSADGYFAGTVNTETTNVYTYFGGVDENNMLFQLYLEFTDLELWFDDIDQLVTKSLMDTISSDFTFASTSQSDYAVTALTMHTSGKSLGSDSVIFDDTVKIDEVINEWTQDVTQTYEPLLNDQELYVSYTCYSNDSDTSLITLEDYGTTTAPSWVTPLDNGTLVIDTPGVTVDTVYQFYVQSTFAGTDYKTKRLITLFIDYTAPSTTTTSTSSSGSSSTTSSTSTSGSTTTG